MITGSGYADKFAFSQSAIKDWKFKHPQDWEDIWIDCLKEETRDNGKFLFGSLTDTLLFDFENREQKYCIGEEKLPSSAVASIMNCVYEQVKVLCIEAENLPFIPTLEEFEDVLVQCADSYTNDEGKQGWNSRWLKETRIKNLIKEGEEYFRTLWKARGRKIISTEMNIQAINACEELNTNPITRPYFVATQDNIVLFQVEIFVPYKYHDDTYTTHVPLKGALDIVRIDLINKTIQIADFKTSMSVSSFPDSIKKFGYGFQLSFYQFLLHEWIKTYEDGKYKDFKVLNPINIVKDSKHKPEIFQYRKRDLDIERFGNIEYLTETYGSVGANKIKRGWEELLKEICWHWVRNQWNTTKEMYENGYNIVNLIN